MNWKPGRPTRVEGLVVGAAGVADGDDAGREVLERGEPGFEDRAHHFVALQVDAADTAGAVIDVEVAREFLVLGRWSSSRWGRRSAL